MPNLGLQQVRNKKRNRESGRQTPVGPCDLDESDKLLITRENTCSVLRLNSNKDFKFKSVIALRACNSHRHFPSRLDSFHYSFTKICDHLLCTRSYCLLSLSAGNRESPCPHRHHILLVGR